METKCLKCGQQLFIERKEYHSLDIDKYFERKYEDIESMRDDIYTDLSMADSTDDITDRLLCSECGYPTITQELYDTLNKLEVIDTLDQCTIQGE